MQQYATVRKSSAPPPREPPRSQATLMDALMESDGLYSHAAAVMAPQPTTTMRRENTNASSKSAPAARKENTSATNSKPASTIRREDTNTSSKSTPVGAIRPSEHRGARRVRTSGARPSDGDPVYQTAASVYVTCFSQLHTSCTTVDALLTTHVLASCRMHLS
jgi:hypothetical protein